MEDSQDEDENSGDELPSDAENDVPQPKSTRLNRAPKRTRRVSRSKRHLSINVMTDIALSQSIDSSHHQVHKGSVESSCSSQIQYQNPPAQGSHQIANAPDQPEEEIIAYGRFPHELNASQRMPTLNRDYHHHSHNQPGGAFYGSQFIAGSDSEGLNDFR